MGRFGILAGWRRRLPLVLVAVLGVGSPLAMWSSAQAAVTTPGGYTSVAPSRLLDTRSGVGVPAAGVVPAYGTVALKVTGLGGVPASGVSAVVLNVTVTAPTRAGYVTAYGDGTTRPTASNLNFVIRQTVPNLVIAPVGSNGKVALYNGSPGTVHLIADVSGYFLSGAPTVAGAFGSLAPSRLLDTRVPTGVPTAVAVAAHGTVALQVAGRGGVPGSGVSGVVLNVTVTAPKSAGFVTVYGDGTSFPTASNLNFVAGQTVPNLVIAPVGSNGKVALYNGSGGTLHLIADVSGWFSDTTRVLGVPGPVTHLTAAPGSTTMVLSWTNPVEESLSAVMIRRAVGTTAPASASAGTLVTDAAEPAATFTDTALTPGTTYSYALFAHDLTPLYAAGATVTETTLLAPPGPVTSVGATPGSTTIALSWTNPPQAWLTGVMIRRAQGGVAPSSESAGTLVANVSQPATTFTDTPLTPGTQYSYALFAHDGTPLYASAATITTSTLVAPPGPVTGVSATPGSTTIALSWTNPPQASLTGVMIRRAAGAVAPSSVSAGSLVVDVAKPGTAYTDIGLAPGTPYSYALFAHDGTTPVRFYATGATVTSTTTTVLSPPGPVTGVSATAGSTTIGLSWTNPPQASLTGVMIRRAAGAVAPSSASAGTLVADVAKPGTTLTDGGAVPGTQYSYALFAHDGTVPVRFYATGATVTTTTIPLPVTDVRAVPGSNSIVLSWTNPDVGSLAGVMIRRAEGAVPPASATSGEEVWDVASPGAGFTDNGLRPGTQYSYALFAHNDTPGYATAATATATTRAPGALRGTVTDSAGTPHGLAHVDVTIHSESTITRLSAATDANGQYRFDLLPAATDYTVCFNASTATTGGSSDVLGYVDQCYDNQPILGTPTPVSVTPGATTNINAALVGGGAVAGTVTDAAGTHHGLANVDVTVHFGSATTTVAGTATTDLNGSYRVTGLAAAADYTVCFTTSALTGGGSSDETGYVDQCYRNPPTSGTLTPVGVTLGQTTSGINAALNGGGAISGMVTDSAGSHPVLAGVEVSVYSPTMSPRSATTDVHGIYRLPGLPGGTEYTVCFNGANATGGTSTFGYFFECYNDVQTADQATLLSVLAGRITTEVNASLTPRDESHT